jgi:hypothetical protein
MLGIARREQLELTELTEENNKDAAYLPPAGLYAFVAGFDKKSKFKWPPGWAGHFLEKGNKPIKKKDAIRSRHPTREQDGILGLMVRITTPPLDEPDGHELFFETLSAFKQMVSESMRNTHLRDDPACQWLVPFIWVGYFLQIMAPPAHPMARQAKHTFRELPADCRDLKPLLSILAPGPSIQHLRPDKLRRQIDGLKADKLETIKGNVPALLRWIDLKLAPCYKPVSKHWQATRVEDFQHPLGVAALKYEEYIEGECKTVVTFDDQAPDEVRIDLDTACAISIEIELNANQVVLKEAYAETRRLRRLRPDVLLRVVAPTGHQRFLSMQLFNEEELCRLVASHKKAGYRIWGRRPLRTGDWLFVSRAPENPAVPRLLLKAVVAAQNCMPANVALHGTTLEALLGGDYDGDKLRLTAVHNPNSLLHIMLLAQGFAALDTPQHEKGQRLLSGHLLRIGLTWEDRRFLSQAMGLIVNRDETILEAILKEQATKHSRESAETVLEALKEQSYIKRWPQSSQGLGLLWRCIYGPNASTQLWCRLEELEHFVGQLLDSLSPLRATGLSPERAVLTLWAQAKGVQHVKAAPTHLRAELLHRLGHLLGAIERLPLEWAEDLIGVLQLDTSEMDEKRREKMRILLGQLKGLHETDEPKEARILFSWDRLNGSVNATRNEPCGLVPSAGGLCKQERFGWNSGCFNGFSCQEPTATDASATDASVYAQKLQWMGEGKALAAKAFEESFHWNAIAENLNLIHHPGTGGVYVRWEDETRDYLMLASTPSQLRGLPIEDLKDSLLHVPFGYLKGVEAHEPFLDPAALYAELAKPEHGTPAHRHHFWACLFTQGLRWHSSPCSVVEIWSFKTLTDLALVVYLNEASDEDVVWGSVQCNERLLESLRCELKGRPEFKKHLFGQLRFVVVCATKVQNGACGIVQNTRDEWGVPEVPFGALSLEEHQRSGILGWLNDQMQDLQDHEMPDDFLPTVECSLVPGILKERRPAMMLPQFGCLMCYAAPLPPSEDDDQNNEDALLPLLQKLRARCKTPSTPKNETYLLDLRSHSFQDVPLRLAACLRTRDNLDSLFFEFSASDMPLSYLQEKMRSDDGEVYWSLVDPRPPELYRDPAMARSLPCGHTEASTLVAVACLNSREVGHIPSQCSRCHVYDRGLPATVRRKVRERLGQSEALVLLAFDHAPDLPCHSFTMLLFQVLLPLRTRFLFSALGKMWYMATGTAAQLRHLWTRGVLLGMLEDRSFRDQPKRWPRPPPDGVKVELLQSLPQNGGVVVGVPRSPDAGAKAELLVSRLRAVHPVHAPLVDQGDMQRAQVFVNESGGPHGKGGCAIKQAAQRPIWIRSVCEGGPPWPRDDLPVHMSKASRKKKKRPQLERALEALGREVAKAQESMEKEAEKVQEASESEAGDGEADDGEAAKPSIQRARQTLMWGRESTKIGPVRSPGAWEMGCPKLSKKWAQIMSKQATLCVPFETDVYVRTLDFFAGGLEEVFALELQTSMQVTCALAELCERLPVPYRHHRTGDAEPVSEDLPDFTDGFVNFHANYWTHNLAELYQASAIPEPGLTGMQAPMPKVTQWDGQLPEDQLDREYDVHVNDKGLALVLMLASELANDTPWKDLFKKTQESIGAIAQQGRDFTPSGFVVTEGRETTRKKLPLICPETLRRLASE